MAQTPPIGASATSWNRSRVAIAVVAAILFFGSLFLNPIGVREDQIPEWFGLMLICGLVFCPPVLFGLWGALGPGGMIRRVLLTTIVLCAIVSAGCFRGLNLLGDTGRESEMELGEWLYPLALYVITLLLGRGLRRFTGWQIIRDTSEEASARNQISLKFLLICTAACAVFLTVARTWTDTSEFAQAGWTDELFEILKFIGLVLLILFPILIAPFVVLLPRWSRRAFATAFALWVCFTWFSVEMMAAIENDSRLKAFTLILAIQAGCLVVAGTSAALLRWAGYRILKLPTNAGTSS